MSKVKNQPTDISRIDSAIFTRTTSKMFNDIHLRNFSKSALQLLPYLFIVLLGCYLGYYTAGNLYRSVLGFTFSFLASYSFFRPKQGLYLLCITLPVSFELNLGSISQYGIRTALSGYGLGGQQISLNVYDIVLLALFSSTILRRAIAVTTLRVDRLFKLLMLFGAIAFVSLILAYNNLHFTQWKICFLYLLKLLEIFFIYFLTINIVEDYKDIIKIINLLLTVAIAVSVLGLYNYLFSSYTNFVIPVIADRSNYFGFLNLIVPIALTLLFGKGYSCNKKKSAIVIILSSICIMMVMKRALIFALTASVIVWAIMNKKLHFVLPIVLVIFIMLSFLYTSFVNQVIYSVSYNFVDPDYTFGSYSSPELRKEIEYLRRFKITEIPIEPAAAERIIKWAYTLKHFPEHAIFGVGYWAAKYRFGVYPHNIYISVLVEMGLIGFIIFILIIRQILKLVWNLQRKNDDFIKNVSSGFVASIVGVLIIGLSEEVFFDYQLMGSFWLILGLLSQSCRLRSR